MSITGGCAAERPAPIPAVVDEPAGTTDATAMETGPMPAAAGPDGTEVPVAGREEGSETAPRGGHAAVFECPGGSRFLVRYEGGLAWLENPAGHTVRLERQPSASGAKFAADGLTVWSKGEEAMIEAGGERHMGCRRNRAASAWEQARLDGVRFRALGNEPGWILEIDEDSGIDLVTDYGQTRLRFDRLSRSGSAAEGTIRYEARGDDQVIVVLTFVTCHDDMSGQSYPIRAELRLGGRTYRGCGRQLGN
jgi:putative lipoprotein